MEKVLQKIHKGRGMEMGLIKKQLLKLMVKINHTVGPNILNSGLLEHARLREHQCPEYVYE